MRLVETELPGCVILEPSVFGDARGYFKETWNQQRFAELGIDTRFVQSNVSRSAGGVLRGLHYQWPNPQAKLVWVLEGSVLDVAVDLRRGSPHFGRWTSCLLSAENHRQLFVPEGFGHGFVVLGDGATFAYLCSAVYQPACDRVIAWDDPQLAIDWQIDAPSLSAKDRAAPRLADVSTSALPEWQA